MVHALFMPRVYTIHVSHVKRFRVADVPWLSLQPFPSRSARSPTIKHVPLLYQKTMGFDTAMAERRSQKVKSDTGGILSLR